MSKEIGKLRWCYKCNVPLVFDSCPACQSKTKIMVDAGRFRPVFKEELEVLHKLLGEPIMEEPKDFVLWRNRRGYFAAGNRVFSITGRKDKQELKIHDHELMSLLRGEGCGLFSGDNIGSAAPWLDRSPDEVVEALAMANAPHLKFLEDKAIGFLRNVRQEYPDMPLAVSWSGGKDSMVTSDIVTRAFPDEHIPHIFADTTIELPTTYEFIKEFRRHKPSVPFLIGVPVRDFFELCREIGPPSRVMRWCCTTHKAVPLTDLLIGVGHGGPVLVASGIRHTESARRQGYDAVVEGDSKIGIQIMINPILDWTDIDIWFWTIARRLPINKAYKLGMNRVGCYCCPMGGSAWCDVVMRVAFEELRRDWEDFLIDCFASSGMNDPEDYVASGAWRMRCGAKIGADGLPEAYRAQVVTTPCEKDETTVTYTTPEQFDINQLTELLKPFGEVIVELHDDISFLRVDGPYGVIQIKAIPYWKRVRATFESKAHRARFSGTLRMQIRKLNVCVGCGACMTVCQHGAIIGVGNNYAIAAKKCVHCLNCVRGIKAGCKAADSLA